MCLYFNVSIEFINSNWIISFQKDKHNNIFIKNKTYKHLFQQLSNWKSIQCNNHNNFCSKMTLQAIDVDNHLLHDFAFIFYPKAYQISVPYLVFLILTKDFLFILCTTLKKKTNIQCVAYRKFKEKLRLRSFSIYQSFCFRTES